MDGSNPNQNKQNPNTNNNQKPGLSWTQPVNPAAQNRNTPRANPVPPPDSTGRVMGIIVGIVVVFALAAWGIVALHKRAASTEVSTTATSTNEVASNASTNTTDTSGAVPTTPTINTKTVATAPMQTAAAGSASLSVPSPQSAGNVVEFTDLRISDPTWILVYDNDAGSPGRILGAGLFFKGDTSGSVNLLRPTMSGREYFVSAAIDNGEKSFVKANEKYVLDQSGQQMWIKFQTR